MEKEENSNMIYLLLIIILLLSMPLKIKIIRNDHKNDLRLVFTKIFNYTIDLDELIKFFLTTKENRDQITLDGILYNIGLFSKMKRIIKSFLKMVHITKITIITKQNISNSDLDVFAYVMSWTLISFFQNKLRRRVHTVRNEYYSVTREQSGFLYDVNLECDLQIRILFILLAVIINIKDIPKIIKYIKGSKKNEFTSNI